VEDRKALKALLAANKRLNTAHLLKKSFAQPWDYKREGWAGQCFENWCHALKRRQLKPFKNELAQMVENHWDGTAAYARRENFNFPRSKLRQWADASRRLNKLS
jgi:transposase